MRELRIPRGLWCTLKSPPTLPVDGEVATPIPSRLTVSASEVCGPGWVLGAGITRVMSYKEATRRTGALVLLEDFEREPLPVRIVYRRAKRDTAQAPCLPGLLTPRLKERLASHAG
jgi:hypothetical protein